MGSNYYATLRTYYATFLGKTCLNRRGHSAGAATGKAFHLLETNPLLLYN